MALWQLDLIGGIYLADGRECKVLSGIDAWQSEGKRLGGGPAVQEAQ